MEKKVKSRKKKQKFCLNCFELFILISIIVFLLSSLTILSLREILPSQIDDISPGIVCNAGDLRKSDILWVIPLFNNQTPSREWCDAVLALDKELGMHGVYHTYTEFYYPVSEDYLYEGMKTFKECFGYYPTKFKAPQLNISQENKLLVKKYMELEGELNQFFHKVYHCSDTGIVSNEMIDWF